MEAVRFALAVGALALALVAFVGVMRSVGQNRILQRAIEALRARYGLDRGRWADVRRSVHRGTAAPSPLGPAARAYAQALLDAPGHGTGSGWLSVGMVSVLLGATSGLLNEGTARGVVWLTVAGMVVSAYALVLQLVLRRRRPARARAALSANR